MPKKLPNVPPLRISASERHLFCPGAARAALIINKSAGHDDTPESIMGSLAHKFIGEMLAGKTRKLLSIKKEQMRAYSIACWFSGIVAKIEAGYGDPIKTLTERDVYIRDAAGVVRWTGHTDRIAIFNEVVLVWDYKTGFRSVTPAHENFQLRGYAVGIRDLVRGVGLWHEKMVTHLLSAGEEKGEHLSSCEFTDRDLDMAHAEFSEIYHHSNAQKPPRVPDIMKQCRFCPACGTWACPESTAETTALDAWKRVNAVAAPEMNRLYELACRVEPVVNMIKDGMRASIAAHKDGIAFQFGESTVSAHVTDNEGAFAAMSALIPHLKGRDLFTQISSLSVQDLADYYRQHAIKSGHEMTRKQARKAVEKQLARHSAVEFTPKAAPIIPIIGKKENPSHALARRPEKRG